MVPYQQNTNLKLGDANFKKRGNKHSKALSAFDCLWFNNPFTPKNDFAAVQPASLMNSATKRYIITVIFALASFTVLGKY